MKNARKYTYLGLIAGVLLIISTATVVFVQRPVTTVPHASIALQTQSFVYKGESGKSALVLLKNKASVTQAASGLVTTINARKAEDRKHEYWAFYINGRLSQVGPATYMTKNSDTIEWKIEKY